MSCSSCSRIFLMEDGAILASDWSAQIDVTSHWSWAENSIGRYRNYYFLIGGTKVPSDNVQNSLQFCVDIKSIKNQTERLDIISYLINGKFPREFKDQNWQKTRRNHLVTKYKVISQNRLWPLENVGSQQRGGGGCGEADPRRAGPGHLAGGEE